MAINRPIIGSLSALNESVDVSTLNTGAIGIQITGTWSGTVTFEATVDGVTWNPWFVSQLFVVGPVNTATVNAFFRGRNSGFSQIRVRASVWNSGTATVTVQCIDGTGAVLADQGTPSTLPNAWPFYIADVARGAVIGRASSPLPADVALVTSQQALATFVASSAGTDAGNGKSMLSVMNAGGSPVIVNLRFIYIRIVSGTALGPDILFQLHRITSHSGGSLITPASLGSAALDSNVTVRVGGTVGGEGTFIDRWTRRSVDTLNTPYESVPAFNAAAGSQPLQALKLAAGEGVHIKCATNSSAGSWDVVFYFTQE